MAYFTALPVPPEVTQALQAIRPELKDAVWTHPDDYHLTLKYLGDPSPQVLEDFHHVLTETRCEPLLVRPLGLHVFERPDLHFLVLLTERTAPLHALHHQQEAVATALGIAPYVFPEFTPHITLASYPPQLMDVSQLDGAGAPAFVAEGMNLYQSNKPHGTGVGRYQVLETYPFRTS